MRYKLFGKHTGLRVSELVLGAGNFGTRWGHGADPDEAARIFNAYADAGGNFIDTANGYQFGQSEEILGGLLSGRRDDFVLATKFTFQTDPKAGILVTGNSRRSMVSSVEASLNRLKTDRIDLYWAHVSDGVTPVEEIVRGFDDLARAGKILYAGLSDFPAWRWRGPQPSPNCAALRPSPVFRSSTASSNARPSRSFCLPAKRSASALSLGRRLAAAC
jgi:aryl-alcohol dehydrogenase-like predicted oxidoreductase